MTAQWEPRPTCLQNHPRPLFLLLILCLVQLIHFLHASANIRLQLSFTSYCEKTEPQLNQYHRQPRPVVPASCTMAAVSGLTLLMKVFEQEKELFWRTNASLGEQELQRRWSAETGDIRSFLDGPQVHPTTANGIILQPTVTTPSAPSMEGEQSVRPSITHPSSPMLTWRRRPNTLGILDELQSRRTIRSQ